MEKRPYVIMAPPYRHNSAGVRALYELQKHLEVKGYKCRIARSEYALPEEIVIYPETVSGNPLKGKTVVRYVLYYPGTLAGDKEYAKDEIIFTWDRDYYDAPLLTIPLIEDFFRDEGLQREGGCFWVGKGIDMPRIPETEGLTEITYEWPSDRKDLARLFNEKEVFYTYDDMTSLTPEALRCGCKVIVVSGKTPNQTYQDSIKDFDTQLDKFIRITQEAARKILKISFGCISNHPARLNMALRQSEIEGTAHVIRSPESATKALNELLFKMECEGADVAILTHHDMSYRSTWLSHIRAQLALLPDSWIVAGIVGKDMEGRICGKFQDTRIPAIFETSDIHTFPQPASCFDECCIIVNLHKGFRFDETLEGFDLYGTMCVLQTWEMGGTAWILDSGAYSIKAETPYGDITIDFSLALHHCTRPFTWFPDETFSERFAWLHRRFPGYKIDTTVLAEIKPQEEATA